MDNGREPWGAILAVAAQERPSRRFWHLASNLSAGVPR